MFNYSSKAPNASLLLNGFREFCTVILAIYFLLPCGPIGWLAYFVRAVDELMHADEALQRKLGSPKISCSLQGTQGFFHLLHVSVWGHISESDCFPICFVFCCLYWFAENVALICVRFVSLALGVGVAPTDPRIPYGFKLTALGK